LGSFSHTGLLEAISVIFTHRPVGFSHTGLLEAFSYPNNNKEGREGLLPYVVRRESKREAREGSIYTRGTPMTNRKLAAGYTDDSQE
jgi:hypothetical protein